MFAAETNMAFLQCLVGELVMPGCPRCSYLVDEAENEG